MPMPPPLRGRTGASGAASRSLRTARYKCLAWTFAAFLPRHDDSSTSSQADDEEDYYDLLGLSRDATPDDIRRAYKKKSLQLHPDKLRQRNADIDEDEARKTFQHMKEAYETLSDPSQREMYDALGKTGMKFIHDPTGAFDPASLSTNLAKSRYVDRAKLMVLVITGVGLALLQPILICSKVEQILSGDGALVDANWTALLVPTWIVLALAGALLVSTMNMLLILQWIAVTVSAVFLALKWDSELDWDYAAVFIPLYVWEALRLVRAVHWIRSVHREVGKMVTLEYLERHVLPEEIPGTGHGGGDDGDEEEGAASAERRLYADLTDEERDKINAKYTIVHVPPGNEDRVLEDEEYDPIEDSPEYKHAMSIHSSAVETIQIILLVHAPTIGLVVANLDGDKDWNWGLIFLPFWISLFLECLTKGCCKFLCAGGPTEEMAARFAAARAAAEEAEASEHAEAEKDGEKEAKSKVDEAEKGNDDAGGGDDEHDKDAPKTASEAAAEQTKGDADGPAENKADEGEGSTKEEAARKGPASQSGDANAVEDGTNGNSDDSDDRQRQMETELEACRSMKIGELKKELAEKGISTASFVEKSEFAAALAKARVDGVTGPSASGGDGGEETSSGHTKEDGAAFGRFTAADYEYEDGDEFHFDEDTYRAFFEASEQAESRAIEEQSKACMTCCLVMLQTLVLALFVGKLNQVQDDERDGTDDSFSSYWVLFPFLFLAGMLVCCCASAICCAREVKPPSPDDNEEGEENQKDEGGGGNGDVEEGGGVATANGGTTQAAGGEAAASDAPSSGKDAAATYDEVESSSGNKEEEEPSGEGGASAPTPDATSAAADGYESDDLD